MNRYVTRMMGPTARETQCDIDDAEFVLRKTATRLAIITANIENIVGSADLTVAEEVLRCYGITFAWDS